MAESPKTAAQLLASYLMSLAIIALAIALVYSAYQLSRVSFQIPDILASVNQTSEKVEPIVTEVGQIRALIPDILHEVEQARRLVPPILKEVEQTRQTIPPLLQEVEAVRKELPAVLESADKASDAVVAVSREVKATRPLIPQVLKEVETTRESIPPMLDRAEAMIDNARVAGHEASSGAVTGFFKGLITTPFKLVGDAGRSITGMSEEELRDFTDKDFELIEMTALDLLNNAKKGDSREITNPDSGFRATIRLVALDSRDEDFTTVDCRTLQMDSYRNGDRIKTINRTFCKEEGSAWEFEEQ